MTREQLAHILRAASTIADASDVLVIGSQSILGSYDEESLPAQAWLSMEADIVFLDDDDGRKADAVDGAIGELSGFHEMYAYYAQGVSVSTAVLPDGWESRVVAFDARSSIPAEAKCLEPHDLVVSKLVAMREKDQVFADALIRAGLVDPEILRQRAEALSGALTLQRRAVLSWLASRTQA